MLLNISNHPSSYWPVNQTAAAIKQFDSISDLGFPQIDPEADTAQVEKIADNLVEVIMHHHIDTPLKAVHLMGEMTLTVALVGKIQQRGIMVVCSTTRRNVLVEADGRKTSVFEFVRFREYPKLL